MKNLIGFGLFALVLLVGCSKGNRGNVVTHIDFEDNYSADKILNNNMPRRKASPMVNVVYDTTGFAKNRLYHTPKIGIHPRILFGPQDLPRIRRQLQITNAGRSLFLHVKNELAMGIDKPGTRENIIFEACLNQEIEQIEAAWNSKTLKNGTSWHHRDAFRISLMLKAWRCLIEDNKEEGKKVAQALTGYAMYLEPKMDEINKSPDSNAWWKFGHEVFGWLNASVPFSYDWVYNFMDSEQQEIVRRLISKITYGKYNLGMDMPDHWINWNHIGGEMYFPLYALAIEGEEGYDARIYANSVDVARSFFDYGISKKGMSKESIGYTGGGMTHMTTFMIAAANRGDVLFTHPHYRNQIDWYLSRLQPYGREWVSRGDVGFSEPAPEPLMAHKFFYPKDSKVDFVFRNLGFNQASGNINKYTDVDTQGIDNEKTESGSFNDDFFMELMLLCPEDPLSDVNGQLVDYNFGQKLDLENSFFDPERGSMSTKTGWGENELQLQFDCRIDTRMASHDHSDRGSFDLAALGRLWTREDSRLISSKDHSVVLIDGVGQGYFAPFGIWKGFYDSELATFGVADAKYCYDWKWEKEFQMGDVNNPKFKKEPFKWMKEKIQTFDRKGWEYDPSPQIVDYYKDYLDGDPRMWHEEDSWVIRHEYNPVLRAFRTCGLVRGKNPYVLLVDDIQKNQKEHFYEWLMALPEDLEIETMDLESPDRQDIILREIKGERRLLVRVLECEGLNEVGMETYNANLRNYNRVKRLNISSKSVSPNFKIMLYPIVSEELPVTRWSADKSKLEVSFKNQQDVIEFNTSIDKITEISIFRGGKQIVTTSEE